MCRGGDGSPRFFCLLHDCINFHFGVYIVSNGKFCGTQRTYKYDLTGSFESKLMENIPTWKGAGKILRKRLPQSRSWPALGRSKSPWRTARRSRKPARISRSHSSVITAGARSTAVCCSAHAPSNWSVRPVPATAAATPRSGSPPFPGWAWLPATATMTSVGDTRQFQHARQMATLLGLVPRQHSSGGKPTLLGKSQAWRRLPPYAGHAPR
jgi:hypothetical protein